MAKWKSKTIPLKKRSDLVFSGKCNLPTLNDAGGLFYKTPNYSEINWDEARKTIKLGRFKINHVYCLK